MAVVSAAPISLVHGLNVVSFYDPATGAVLQLNKLTPESRVHLRPMESQQTTPTGGSYYGSDHSTLTVHSLDLDLYEELYQWMAEDRLVSAVGVGPNGALQWYETDLLRVALNEIEGESGGRVTMTVSMERRGHGRHNIHFGQNLLSFLGWQDANGNGVADGFTSMAPVNTFVGGAQTISTVPGPAASPVIWTRVVFPVQGVPLRLSNTIVSMTVGSVVQTMIQENFATTDLAFIGPNATAPGRFALPDFVSLPGMYQVEVRPAQIFPAAIGQVTFRDLALRVDGRTEYTAF